MKNRLQAIVYVVIISGFLFSCNTRRLQVSSPDNTVKVLFSLVDGKPQYTIAKNGKTIIEPSAMGFDIMHHTDGHTRYYLLSFGQDSKRETWEQPWENSDMLKTGTMS